MAPQAPEIVGQILAIPVAHIVVGDRLRPIDPVWAEALGQIMAVEGQKTPIEVCQLPGHRDYLLVAGAHRLAAAQTQAWKTINAIVVDNSALERRVREVSENIWRKGLGPIDRAAFVAELSELLKAKAGVDPAASAKQIAAQARWQKELKNQADDTTAMIAVVYGFADQVGDQLGLSVRTVRNDLLLHRRLPAALIARLRGLPLASNAAQLRALAKLDEAMQRQVVDLIVEGKAKGVADALGMLRQKPKPDAEKKAWSAFFGSWSRMNARRRREALRELAEQGLPKGIRITFDGDDQ